MFEGYLGSALRLVRVKSCKTQQEVLHELNKRTKSNFSQEYFDGMEKDIEVFSTEIFDIWCGIFPVPKVKILKIAQHLEQNSHRPEKELLEEIVREIEYQRWKNSQDN